MSRIVDVSSFAILEEVDISDNGAVVELMV